MFTTLGAIISAGLKFALSYFLPSKDEKLGQAEEANKIQAGVIKDEQVAKNVGDRVDNMSTADANQLQFDLNDRR